ncbi:MAG: hypothetical protein ABH969_01560 [Pseudomonadota bacterium]
MGNVAFERACLKGIEHTKICILDTLGCGLFGSTLPWAKIVANFTQELGGKPEAVLSNGTAVHSFELGFFGLDT